MIRDCDRIYGGIVTRRLRAMGIRDQPIVPVSPWQNGFAERLIGSIRESAWIISSFSVRPIYAESCDPTPAITTRSERVDHWIKMRRSLAQFSGPEASYRAPSLADSITITFALRFSVHTRAAKTGGSPFFCSISAACCGVCVTPVAVHCETVCPMSALGH